MIDAMPEMSTTILIDAICGCSPSIEVCDRLANAGFMRFTGNQWNERWDWDRTAINSMSSTQLTELYNFIKRQ